VCTRDDYGGVSEDVACGAGSAHSPSAPASVGPLGVCGSGSGRSSAARAEAQTGSGRGRAAAEQASARSATSKVAASEDSAQLLEQDMRTFLAHLGPTKTGRFVELFDNRYHKLGLHHQHGKFRKWYSKLPGLITNHGLIGDHSKEPVAKRAAGEKQASQMQTAETNIKKAARAVKKALQAKKKEAELNVAKRRLGLEKTLSQKEAELNAAKQKLAKAVVRRDSIKARSAGQSQGAAQPRSQKFVLRTARGVAPEASQGRMSRKQQIIEFLAKSGGKADISIVGSQFQVKKDVLQNLGFIIKETPWKKSKATVELPPGGLPSFQEGGGGTSRPQPPFPGVTQPADAGGDAPPGVFVFAGWTPGYGPVDAHPTPPLGYDPFYAHQTPPAGYGPLGAPLAGYGPLDAQFSPPPGYGPLGAQLTPPPGYGPLEHSSSGVWAAGPLRSRSGSTRTHGARDETPPWRRDRSHDRCRDRSRNGDRRHMRLHGHGRGRRSRSRGNPSPSQRQRRKKARSTAHSSTPPVPLSVPSASLDFAERVRALLEREPELVGTSSVQDAEPIEVGAGGCELAAAPAGAGHDEGGASRGSSGGGRGTAEKHGEAQGGGSSGGELAIGGAADEWGFKSWLLELDGGRGGFLQYLDSLSKEFDSFAELSAAVSPVLSGESVVKAVDPVVYEVLGIHSAGHRLVFARALVKIAREREGALADAG